MKWQYLIIMGMLLLASCKTSGKLGKEEAPLKKKKSDFLIEKMFEKQGDFKTLSADLKLDGEFDGSNYRLGGNLRMIRDSAIWMNLTKFGFEMGRLMITPDSFFMLNRLNREYLREPISELENLSGIKADFTFVQELLIGKVRYEVPPMPESRIVNNLYHLLGNAPFADLALETFLDRSYDYEKVIYNDSRRSLHVNYLEKGESQLLLADRRFMMENGNDEKEFDVECSFDKVEKDLTFSLKFEIPRRYDRI